MDSPQISAEEESIKEIRDENYGYEEEKKLIALFQGLLYLPLEQRRLIMHQFCHSCSRHDPSCQCWNDE